MKQINFIVITILFLLADFCAVSFYLQPPSQALAPYFTAEVKAVGYIEPLSLQQKEGRISFILACEDVYVGRQRISYREKLRVYQALKPKKAKNEVSGKIASHASLLTGKSNTAQPLPKAGRVMVTGELQELRGFANPGSFNMTNYNWVQGLGGMVRNAQIRVLEPKPRLLDYFALVNLRLRDFVAQYAGASAALLNGMVLGGSNGLSTEARESFSTNGLSHLLSVSGTHLILLAGFLSMLLRKLKVSSYWVVLLLTAYACLCGLKPPVLRALGMSAVLMWGQGKQAERSRIFCVLIMLFLLYKPVWILDLGFQLSFGAAAGLLWLLPKIKLKLEAYLGGAGWLTEGIAVTMAAQLATLPFLVGNFYTVSLIAIISNILLVPILELATILTLLGMLSGCVLAPVGGLLIKLAAWLADQVLVQAAWLQAVPLSTLVVGSLPAFCGVIYYALLIVWLDLSPALLLSRKQRSCFLVTGSLLIWGCYAWRQWLPLPTAIYFLDVGQGDAAVIMSPEHKLAVIDTGGLASLDTGAKILTPFVHSLGKREIEVFIPSHGDKDHIGGSAGLARNIRIKNIIMPMEELDKDSLSLYEALLQNAKSAKVSFAKKNDEVQLGGTALRVVEPLTQKLQGNDASTLVEVIDGKTGRKAFFTGDMSSKREAQLRNLGQCAVLKVGHHGSKSSTSEGFLRQLQPKLAVISCGLNNRYGHPHQSVVERLETAGVTVLRTDLQGCIKVEFVEQGIAWQEWR